MKHHVILASAGLVIAGIAAVIAVRNAQARAEAQVTFDRVRESNRTVAQQAAERAARAGAAELRRDALATELAAARRRQSDATKGSALPSGRPGGDSPTQTGVSAAIREALHADPALQALYLKSGHSRLASELGPFYVAAGISPEQADLVQSALLRRQEQLMDLAAVGESQGANTRASVATLQKQARDECDATLRATLGADGFQRLQDYERASGPRTIVRQIAAAAVLEGNALTAKQADQLTSLIARATAGYLQGGPADVRTIDWGTVDAEAGGILSPAQFVLLKQSRTRADLLLDLALKRALDAEAARPRPPNS